MSAQIPASGPIDSTVPAFVMDGAGMIVGWNEQAEQRFGWSQAEAMGRRMSELVIPERHRAAHEAGLKYFMKGGSEGAFLNRRLDITMLHRDGREFDVAIQIGSETTPSGRRFPTWLVQI